MGTPLSNPPHAISSRTITQHAAHLAVAAATEHAHSLGIAVNVAVTDASGTLMAFLRMNGAFLHSIDISIDKAYTAAGFGFPTSAWEQMFANDEALRTGLSTRPRLVGIGGGLPIHEDGVRIGAIGVSGGSAEQDEACAQAGINALFLN